MVETETGDGGTAIVHELEHTADIALCVTARSLADLFAGAALGMAGTMVGGELPKGDLEERIELEDADYEGLLVSWLNALLALNDTDGFIPTAATVTITAGPRLEAVVHGVRSVPQKLHIKAATFHMLAVERTDEGWVTTVVFDV